MSKSLKTQITEAVLKEGQHMFDDLKPLSLDAAKSRWFTTKRNDYGSLRLTETGYLDFKRIGIEYVSFKIEQIEKPKISYSWLVIELGNKIKCPFFIHYQSVDLSRFAIDIFDDSIAVWISMHGGVLEYLDSTKNYLTD